MTKALRVTIVGVGSALALIIFMILFAAAMTFLEIKESGEVGLLFLALLFSCWAGTHVALKRWLCPPTTQPPQQPPPLPWWFRHLYFPLATIILYISGRSSVVVLGKSFMVDDRHTHSRGVQHIHRDRRGRADQTMVAQSRRGKTLKRFLRPARQRCGGQSIWGVCANE